MLFDVQAALAEVMKASPMSATTATTATNRAQPGTVSQVSRLSQGHTAEIPPASFLDDGKVATTSPSAPNPEIALSFSEPSAFCGFPYGRAPNGNPRTWTGRIVSMEGWRTLSDWERHGSTDKVWNAMSECWDAFEERRK